MLLVRLGFYSIAHIVDHKLLNWRFGAYTCYLVLGRLELLKTAELLLLLNL